MNYDHIISTAKTDSYDPELLGRRVKAHMEAVGGAELLRIRAQEKGVALSELKVLIKPNLVAARNPEIAATTHPHLIQAVLDWLAEEGIRHITVADSPGGIYTPEHLRGIYRTCGLAAMKLPEGAVLNEQVGFSSVNSPEGFKNHTFNLTDTITGADFIINMPKLKTHAMTGLSGGIKNLFGAVPGLQKPQLHYRWPDPEDFSNMLVELSLLVHPDLVIIDAVDAMEGNGPTGGTPYHMGMTFASRDMYTLDWACAKMMGLKPESILMLKNAKARGLIFEEETTFAEIPEDGRAFTVPDTKKTDFTDNVPGFLRKPFVAVASKLLKSYPVLDKDKCIGCGKCAESCPPEIIVIKDKKAIFTRKNCISCFCCQEMCPMNAIAVKKAL